MLGWLAVRVPVKILYLLMRWLFGLVALVFRGDHAKDAELVGAENCVISRDLRIFMDQAAEPVPAQDPGICS